MDLSIKSPPNSIKQECVSEITAQNDLTKDEIFANASLLKNILTMNKLNNGSINIPDESLSNFLCVSEIHGQMSPDNSETPRERKIRKSRERSRRYRVRLKERALLGDFPTVGKTILQESATVDEQGIVETHVERKRRFARERSKRYRQRLRDRQLNVVPTQHNVVLGDIVLGCVEVMETIAEKRRRLARERYRRIQEKLLDLTTLRSRVPDAAVGELSPDIEDTAASELMSSGVSRKKEKRRRRCVGKEAKKRKKIKTEDFYMGQEVMYPDEDFYMEDTSDGKIPLQSLGDAPQISMQDYLHLYSVSYPTIGDT